jgi:hypothetical protein
MSRTLEIKSLSSLRDKSVGPGSFRSGSPKLKTRASESTKKGKTKKWKPVIRESIVKAVEIHKVGPARLPIYGSDCFGTMCFYGPPKSGKTTLMSDIIERMITPLRGGTVSDDDVAVVILFCPAERPEYESLRELNGFIHVKDDFATKLKIIMNDQLNVYKQGKKRKILLIWDDLFGLVNMAQKEMREVCNTLGAKSRQPETNIVWLIASQYPKFLSVGVRSNTHMSFFSNVSPDHIKMILDVQNSHIKPGSLYRLAHNHQFIAVDNVGGRVYLTKVDK